MVSVILIWSGVLMLTVAEYLASGITGALAVLGTTCIVFAVVYAMYHVGGR